MRRSQKEYWVDVDACGLLGGYNFSSSSFPPNLSRAHCPLPKPESSRPYPLLPSPLSFPGIPFRIRPSGILHPPVNSLRLSPNYSSLHHTHTANDIARSLLLTRSSSMPRSLDHPSCFASPS